jgi:hypothetical protein
MALDQSALLGLEMLKAADVGDRVRQAAQSLYQELIDAEATALIGAGPHERTESRVAQRNGYRPRTLTTQAGDLELRIPKLRAGSFFPSLLERRRRIDQALFAVVMEAYVHGVSTRKVDDLVAAMGAATGISKSEVSRICPTWTSRWPPPGPVTGRRAVPLRVPGCLLLQGPRRWGPPRPRFEGDRAGGAGGHRGHRRRPPRSVGLRRRQLRVRNLLDRVPALADRPRP